MSPGGEAVLTAKLSKSNDDARDEVTSNGIVSLMIHERAVRSTARLVDITQSFSQERQNGKNSKLYHQS